MTAQLPYEILEHIASFSNHADLKSLSVCSQDYNKAVKPLLWRSVTIPLSRLYNDDISNDKRIESMKYTKILRFGVHPSGKRYKRSFYLSGSQKERLLGRYNSIFTFCDPRILHTCFVPDGGLEIAACKFDKLQELHLYQKLIDDATLQALTGLRIELLSVTDGEITDKGISHLKSLANLTKLHIKDCSNFNDDALTQVGCLVGLRQLQISGCWRVHTTGLTNVRSLINLQRLSVCDCNHVSLTDEVLSHLSALVELKELDVKFNDKLTDVGLMYLSNLINLEQLHLSNCSFISDVGILSLTNIVALKDLYLYGGSRITDIGANHILSMFKLEKLSIRCCHFGLHHLFHLVNLKSLQISFYGLEDDVLSIIISTLQRLKCLRLAYIGKVSDSGYSRLSQLVNLEKLTLCSPKLSDEALFSISSLSKLTHLSLTNSNGLTHVGMAHLCNFINLEYLNLHESFDLNDACLSHIGCMLKLKELRIYRCWGITNNGLKNLGGLVNLLTIDVGDCRGISDNGLKHLRNSVNLERLCVSGLDITDKGLFYIAKFVRLKTLNLMFCQKITAKGMKYLRKLKDLEEVNVSNCFGLQHKSGCHGESDYCDCFSRCENVRDIITHAKLLYM